MQQMSSCQLKIKVTLLNTAAVKWEKDCPPEYIHTEYTVADFSLRNCFKVNENT